MVCGYILISSTGNTEGLEGRPMSAREIKHHFDQIDELEAKENLQSEYTVISYPQMKVVRLRLTNKVTIAFTPLFLLAAALFTICWIIPDAVPILDRARYLALALGVIEMIIFYAFGRSELKE